MGQRSWVVVALLGALAGGCGKSDKDTKTGAATATTPGTTAAATAASGAGARSAQPSTSAAASGSAIQAVALPKAVNEAAFVESVAKLAEGEVKEEAVSDAKASSLFDAAQKPASGEPGFEEMSTGDPQAQAGLVEASAFSESAERAPTAEPTKAAPNGFVVWNKVDVNISESALGVTSGHMQVSGAGQYLVKVVVTDESENVITQSAAKRFTLRSEQGGIGGVDFGLDPASGGLEKVKGRVVFSLAAFKVDGDKAALVNYLPVASVDVRYGRIVNGGQTYASIVNGRTFSARAALTNGAWLVNVVRFTYDSQKDCLFTSLAEGQSVGNRVDEFVEYQGCSTISNDQVVFNVDRVCKQALNNEPDCRKHSETLTTPFVLYPYGIGLRGLIFRE
ncbi:MAG: hypothetical protein HY908_28790 [Myxococcales bacterium]|nr:hypothetical protein [Myxococcales bacterium]